jgi:hypothetical protein
VLPFQTPAKRLAELSFCLIDWLGDGEEWVADGVDFGFGFGFGVMGGVGVTASGASTIGAGRRCEKININNAANITIGKGRNLMGKDLTRSRWENPVFKGGIFPSITVAFRAKSLQTGEHVRDVERRACSRQAETFSARKRLPGRAHG